MKILLVVETCGGGSGRHVLDLTEGLLKFGHEVHIAYSPLRATPEFLQKLYKSRAKTVPIAMKTGPGLSDFKAVRELRTYIKEHGPFSVVHGHSSKGGAIARLTTAFSHARKIYTPHAFYTMNPDLSASRRIIYRGIEKTLAFLCTDAVITVSDTEYEHAVKQGFQKPKLKLIVNGISGKDPDKLAPQRHSIRQWLGVAEDTLVVGSVGRLDHQKAPQRIIDAASLVVKENKNSLFVIMGDGPLRKDILKKAESQGISDHILIIENESGEAFMPGFDIYLMSSRYEAMPYVYLEALSAGLPIVSTDVGGAHLAIEQGINGFIVPESDDMTQTAEKLILLGNNKTMRAQFGARSRKKAARYSFEHMLTETLGVYETPNAIGDWAPI
ncbi:MAG: glycosyltransferase [Thiotrichales bacterium]